MHLFWYTLLIMASMKLFCDAQSLKALQCGFALLADKRVFATKVLSLIYRNFVVIFEGMHPEYRTRLKHLEQQREDYIKMTGAVFLRKSLTCLC